MNSPNLSSTSLSDNDDDDAKDLALVRYPEDVGPALWSHPSRARRPPTPIHCPASRLPPEILIHILKQLHSPKDLSSALLVCRTWCECAVELLWHRPLLQQLSRLVKLLRVICSDRQTFQYASFIRRLNFLGIGADIQDSHFLCLDKCTRLERLTIMNCTDVSDETLSRILPNFKHLVALDLTGISATDKSIITVANSARRLQGVNLGNCRNISDVGIVSLATNCPLLRRVKLSGVRQVTDRSVIALARCCPLLLEIDLNMCTLITDVSVRELWTNLHHLRELRLSHCTELTDAAFPAPKEKVELYATNPFLSTNQSSDYPPPLKLPRSFEHLRMLDLTGCHQITDEAIEGIVVNAPKIRNLVLAKCTQLTDAAVESVCKLGKHVHYLHFGHAASITDRSVKALARSCTRLRYVDFACCPLLTDLAVFELSSLPKLRRIGLVHVSNLTDQAIYSLADRDSTLERIHLSYCDQITVLAVHFLLQKLQKLTHLSLTGVPAFRRPELQQFCRSPPREFNNNQRQAFCVYSGKGVHDLRKYLGDLMASVQAEVDTDTDYDAGPEDDAYDEDLEDIPPYPYPPPGGSRFTYYPPHPPNGNGAIQVPNSNTTPPGLNGTLYSLPQSSDSNSRFRGFGQDVVVEAPSPPPPGEQGPSSSQPNGSFLTPRDGASSSSRSGAFTPDLVYAEIGYGQWRGQDQQDAGAGPGPSTMDMMNSNWRSENISQSSTDTVRPMRQVNGYHPPSVGTHFPDARTYHYQRDRPQVLADASNSYQAAHAQPWPAQTQNAGGTSNNSMSYLSSSPTTRELQESIHSAFAGRSNGMANGFHEEEAGAQQAQQAGVGGGGGVGADGRGRNMKRSFRNTLSAAAEQVATSFFFGSRNTATTTTTTTTTTTSTDPGRHRDR